MKLIIPDLKINQLVFTILFCFIFLFPVKSYAHKVYVFAWAENGKIYTESKFSSNKFVKNGKIFIQDTKGDVFLNGITSDKGSFIFDIPDNLKSNIIIKLDAGMGHQAEWQLDFEEIALAEKGGNAKETAVKKKEKRIKKPSIANISAGIFIIFLFFILMAKLNRKKFNKK